MPHRFAAAVATLLLFTVPALAHDLVVNSSAPAEGRVPVEVLITEVFFAPDVLPPLDAVKLRVLTGGKTTDLPLAADAGRKVLTATAETGVAPALVVASLSRNRPARAEPGRPLEPATLSEMSSKALVNAARGAPAFDAPTGGRLEIIALANPADLKVGDELPVQVQFDGEPLRVRLFATHDGFTTREGTFATTAMSEKDGTAHIKITAPGLWVVKVNHSLAEAAPGQGRYNAASNLVFAVQ